MGRSRPEKKFGKCGTARQGWRNQNETLCGLRAFQALTRRTLSLSVTSGLKFF